MPSAARESAQRAIAGLLADLPPADARSSLAGLQGGETAGLAHLRAYLDRQLPHTYKQTCNQLSGIDYSSKWSPWLASGSLSARRILSELRQFEAQRGASDGSYWLWFELLWRDYFRFLHLQHGQRLYRAGGLAQLPAPSHDAGHFDRWRQGQSGQPLIDAAMRELAATGCLSNRLRQVVASYLIYDLGCDWRAGAAWFESQLVDYDVYSNQGNWLYIAGRGSDPRGGRRFNLDKQTAEHDGDGAYRQLWGCCPSGVSQRLINARNSRRKAGSDRKAPRMTLLIMRASLSFTPRHCMQK